MLRSPRSKMGLPPPETVLKLLLVLFSMHESNG